MSDADDQFEAEVKMHAAASQMLEQRKHWSYEALTLHERARWQLTIARNFGGEGRDKPHGVMALLELVGQLDYALLQAEQRIAALEREAPLKESQL